VLPSPSHHPLDFVDVKVARGVPQEIGERAVGLVVDAPIHREFDELDRLVGIGSSTPVRLCADEVDPGIHLREQIAHAPRDCNRVLGTSNRLDLVLQHLDLRKASQRPSQLRRLRKTVEDSHRSSSG
jgi:hypothetical protein